MPIRRSTSNRSGLGFGLLELVFVLAIITVLSVIAVPKYAASLARYRADAAAKRIKAELTLARRTARTSGTSVTVDMSEYQTILSESPYRASIVRTDFDGDETVVFDGYGVPDSGGYIVVHVGNIQRKIVLEAETGRTTVQDLQ